MSLYPRTGLIHVLNRASCEPRFARLAHIQSQQYADCTGQRLRFFSTSAVYADVRKLNAQHGFDRLPAQSDDLVPPLVFDHVLFDHPRSAAGEDLVKREVIHQIFGIYASSRHPL